MPSVPLTRPGDDVRSRLARNPMLVDALVAAGLTAVTLVTIAGGAGDFSRTDELGIVLALLQSVPLAFRRRAPVAVFAVTILALLGHALLASAVFNSSIGSLVALFTVAERCGRRTSIAATVAAGAIVAGVILAKAGLPMGLSGLVQSLLSVFVVWLVGTWAQERQRYIGTVEERARRAEHDRETRAALAVAEERARIARELHDVVAHHVSVIVIQAGAALRALDRRPAEARTALEAIDGSARHSLTEMRRMLGVLRTGDGGGAVAPDALPAPMPGLDRIGELLEEVRRAGVGTELSVEGPPRPMDPGVELSAYRIAQEALTNTLKHAPDARASVTIRYEPDALALVVEDDGGRGRRSHHDLAHPGEPGRGLLGMRERVALFGGTLEAGPHGRGFRVAARLPVGRPATAADRGPVEAPA